MKETKTYRVLRDHMGPDGQLFSPHGQFNTREEMPGAVGHLVPLTLAEVDDEEVARNVTPQRPAPDPKKEEKKA